MDLNVNFGLLLYVFLSAIEKQKKKNGFVFEIFISISLKDLISYSNKPTCNIAFRNKSLLFQLYLLILSAPHISLIYIIQQRADKTRYNARRQNIGHVSDLLHASY